MMNRILLFCAIAFSVLMNGCAIREMSLSKGQFEAPAHHHFIGAGRNLPENSSINSLTLSGVYVPEEKMRLHGVYNDPKECDSETKDCFFEKSRIKFWYRLDRYPLKGSYTRLYKWQELVAGFEIGVSKYLQGRFIFGLNDKNYEVGMYGDIGYGFNKASYDYKQEEYTLFSLVGENGHLYGESSYSDEYIGHFITAFGGYASLYYGVLGVTYSASLYAPWARRDLPISESHDDFDVFFDFPKFLSQYLGMSFWITNHWKFSAGATLLSPVNMEEFVVMGNSSIGFWF